MVKDLFGPAEKQQVKQFLGKLNLNLILGGIQGCHCESRWVFLPNEGLIISLQLHMTHSPLVGYLLTFRSRFGEVWGICCKREKPVKKDATESDTSRIPFYFLKSKYRFLRKHFLK